MGIMNSVKVRRAVLSALGIAVLGGILAAPARAAEKPLNSDDVLLMLLAGASTDKMLAIIEQRGVDFRMNPDLAQKFHNAGADDLVIEALQNAKVKTPARAPGSKGSTPPDAPSPAAASAPKSISPSDDEDYPPAPAFTLVDLSGKHVSLADLKGQVVVVNFWATWCSRCRGRASPSDRVAG